MRKIIIFMTIAMFLLSACSKKADSKSPENILKELNSSDLTNPLDYYSGNTISALKKAVKLKLVSKENTTSLLYDFNSKVKYDVIKSNRDNNLEAVHIQYRAHPVENRIGQITVINFVLEGNKWKIDKSGDITGFINSSDSTAVKNYLNKKFSNY